MRFNMGATELLFTTDGAIHFLRKDEDHSAHIEVCSLEPATMHAKVEAIQLLGACDCMEHKYVVMVTQDGFAIRIPTAVLKNHLDSSGPKCIAVMNLWFDCVVAAFLTDGNDMVAVFTSDGLVSVFSEDKIPVVENLYSEGGADGELIIRLGKELEDHNLVVDASGIAGGETLLIFTERGYIKRVQPSDILGAQKNKAETFPGAGIQCMELSEVTGSVIAGSAQAEDTLFLARSSNKRAFVSRTNEIPVAELADTALNWYSLEEPERLSMLTRMPEK